MAITDITQVRSAGRISSEISDDDINTEIDIVEADLYDKYYLPKRSQFVIDDDYTNFYFCPIVKGVYEVIRVQVAVETTEDPSGYITVASGSDTWLHSSPNNYLTLGSDFIESYDTKIVRVQYIPKYINGMSSNMVALNLIGPTTIVDGDENEAPIISVLKNRIDSYKKQARSKSLLKSSEYESYNIYDYISYSQSDLR